MTNQKQSPPTIITLTLPTSSDGGIPPDHNTATILIQRGDLAHVRQFHYALLDDLTEVIRKATEALGLLEDHPPVIPDMPAETPKSRPKTKTDTTRKPTADAEPTIDIPLKKGMRTVKISAIRIVGGESDAASYQQAFAIAGRLIDGRLWDGESPIRFDDVYAVAKRMKHLTDKDLSLFTLEDFVQVGAAADTKAATPDAIETRVEDDDIESLPLMNPASLEGVAANSSGQRPDDETDPISLS